MIILFVLIKVFGTKKIDDGHPPEQPQHTERIAKNTYISTNKQFISRSEYDKLKAHVQKRLSITEDEMTEFCEAFKIVKVKKRQFIVQPEFVAKNRFYVIQGTFRAYVIGDEGQEHTIQFAISDWWISDYNSYIFQQPASMFIVALEDSVILQISHEAESALKQKRHVFETFFRVLAEGTAAYMARRVITNLTKTTEQRYEIFIERYPDIVTKVPQYA